MLTQRLRVKGYLIDNAESSPDAPLSIASRPHQRFLPSVLEVSGQLHCRALVIDLENPDYSAPRGSELADILRAPSIHLAELANIDVLEIKSIP